MEQHNTSGSNDRWDARFDHLVDVEMQTPADARAIVAKERQAVEYQAAQEAQRAAVAHGAVEASARLTGIPETPLSTSKANSARHYSRRGGRAYPEASDSELDPYWNGGASYDPSTDTPENQQAFRALADDSHEAAVKALARHSGVSEAEARARLKARREINQR